MAYFPQGQGSPQHQNEVPRQTFTDGAGFDFFAWYPAFQSCVRYFLDHAQHELPVQALAAFINIQLPFQKTIPILSSQSSGSPSSAGLPPLSSRAAEKMPVQAGPSHPFQSAFPFQSSHAVRRPSQHFQNHHADYPQLPPPHPGGNGAGQGHPPGQVHVSLLPYIRRLVVTGFDSDAVLHGFFGRDWRAGVSTLHEVERRNYLFAAKSSNWLQVKAAYDMRAADGGGGDDQTVLFLRPLTNVDEKEIEAAEEGWHQWMMMQDWMLGPRAPGPGPGSGSGQGPEGLRKEENGLGGGAEGGDGEPGSRSGDRGAERVGRRRGHTGPRVKMEEDE